MIEEHLEKIREKEKEARLLVEEARVKAGRMVEEAAENGEKLLDRVRAEVAEEEKKLLDEARKKAEEKIAGMRGESQKSVASLESAAEKRVDRVIGIILEAFGKSGE